MTTMLIVFLIGWALFLVLLRYGAMPVRARAPLASALMLGMAAWAVAGQPLTPAFPARGPVERGFGRPLDDPREGLTDRFGEAAPWLGLSDGLLRSGRTAGAARTLEQALRRHPEDVDLWVGYANALVAHAQGRITPAARLAFERARTLAPDHAAPPYFAALALAQSGDVEGARTGWQAMLAGAPADAPWRGLVERQLAALPNSGAAR